MGFKLVRSRTSDIAAEAPQPAPFPIEGSGTFPEDDAALPGPAKRKRSRHAGPIYPGKVAIRHAGQAARALGLTIGGIEIVPDGTIRVLAQGATSSQPKDEFAEWLAAGKLA